MIITLRKKLIAFCVPTLVLTGLILLSKTVWFVSNPSALSVGIIFDLTLSIPLVYYLAIRKTTIPNITVAPVFVIGVVVASLVIPAEHQYFLEKIKTWVIPLIELVVLSVVFLKIRKITIQYRSLKHENTDFFNLLKEAINDSLPAPVNVLLATEIAVFYYGFVHWQKVRLKPNEFSYHKESGSIALLWAVIMLVLVETSILHLLIMQWSVLVAWIISGVSIYTGLQIFGILRSLSKRPISINQNVLYLKYGIMAEAEIPLNLIDRVEQSEKDLSEDKLVRNLSPLGSLESHNTFIYLKKEITVSGLYNIKKNAHTLAFHVDRPSEFINLLDEKMRQLNN